MKATQTTRKTKFTTSHRKEKGGFHAEYSALVQSPYHPTELQAVVTLRLYWPASTCYACLWINAEPVHASGSGQAGCGGYCKASAAAGEAVRNAGFDLSEDIHGRGTSLIGEAVLALAAAVGHPEAKLHVAHA